MDERASAGVFAANIRNPHTRRAYYRAAEEFLAWCASVGVPSIAAVQPVHVAAWIEASMRELATPSVKQQLSALRHLRLAGQRPGRAGQPDWANPGARSIGSARAAQQHRCLDARRPA